LLVDDTGTIRVRLSGALVLPLRLRVFPSVEELGAVGVSVNQSELRGLRCTEGLVTEGTAVAVLGQTIPEPNLGTYSGGYRDAPSSLVLRAPPGGRLLVAADAKIGKRTK
jgi:hypothetical protein